MPRRRRLHVVGDLFHVCRGGIARYCIFEDSKEQMFLNHPRAISSRAYFDAQ